MFFTAICNRFPYASPSNAQAGHTARHPLCAGISEQRLYRVGL